MTYEFAQDECWVLNVENEKLEIITEQEIIDNDKCLHNVFYKISNYMYSWPDTCLLYFISGKDYSNLRLYNCIDCHSTISMKDEDVVEIKHGLYMRREK